MGVPVNPCDEIIMTAIRAKGRDLKERLLMRRIVRAEANFVEKTVWVRNPDPNYRDFKVPATETDVLDAGFYIRFSYEHGTGNDMFQKIDMGPFESDDECADAYDHLIDLFGFSSSLKISKDPWGLSDDDSEDWGLEDDEDPWGLDDDEDEWGL
jgi:hypothetical protein